ncbi:MAG: hypothetical protein GC184_09645 [Rhizobiales bacterium]|nr:hypothetical protein [Hyphomicrobiales bacterium]
MTRLAKMAFFLAALFPAACASKSTTSAPRDVSFVASAPLQLDVASIAVDQRYRSSSTPPNVEQLHPVSPASIAERWATSRVVTTGQRGIATLTVLDGSVVAEKLPLKGGLTGFFGDQQDTKLKARLKARLTVSVPGLRVGDSTTYTADVDASAERTILQSATLNERDAAYMVLMNTLARQFDETLSAEVRRSMSPVLR